MNRIDPRTKISAPKRSKSLVKLHKLEGLDLFDKIDKTRAADLTSLKDKHWKVILGKLRTFVNSELTQYQSLRLQNVFYKVIASTYKNNEIRIDLNYFFSSVSISKCFDNSTPLAKRFHELAENIYLDGDLLALRFAELGFMYHLIGLRSSARNQSDLTFLNLLDKTPPLNWASKDTCYLAIEVLQNFGDDIFEIFLKHSPIPSDILSLIIKNSEVNEEETLFLIQTLVQRGVKTFQEDDAQSDPLEAALLANYRRVVLFLLHQPFNDILCSTYFKMAVFNHDSEAVKKLTAHYQGPLIVEEISPILARSLRPLIESISHFGKKRFLIPEDFRKPLPLIKECVSTSVISSLLADQGILYFQVRYCLSEGTVILINEILKKEPQALSLSHFRKNNLVNPDLYYFILFKRIVHVWSLRLETRAPGLKELLQGEFAPRQFMIAYYVQFLELFNRSWLIPILDKANLSLRNFFDFSRSEQEIKLAIGNSNNEPVVWSSGYSRHYANVVTFKNYVLYCDRGGVAIQSGFRIYEAKDTSHLTPDYMTELLDCSQEPKDSITEEKLVRDWNLRLLDLHEMQFQKINVCTHTGTDSTLIALLTLLSKTADPNLTWKEAAHQVLPLYKKVSAAYRYYTALDLIQAFDFYTQSKRDDITDDYFLKMFLALYLRLKESPNKLMAYTDQGPNLINHLGHIINFLSRD